MRDALATKLSRGSVQVVATVPSSELAIAATLETRPDLVITEVRLPDDENYRLVRRLAQVPSRPRMMIYTSETRVRILQQALARGAQGYALKAGDVEELRWAVDYVLAGNPYVDPRLAPLLGNRDCLATGELSPRELEILGLIAEGMSGSEMARELSIGHETIRTHAAHVLRKLGARNRAHAAALAVARGLFSMPRGPRPDALPPRRELSDAA